MTGNERPREYWGDLKRKLKAEGSELTETIGQLKMQAPDGKMHLTDVADVEQRFRLIPSIRSPKAEPSVQIADFYAGAIGRYFRKSQKDIDLGIDEIYDAIRHKVIPTYFPWNEISLTNVSTLSNDKFNQTIFNIAVESTETYLKSDGISDTDREIVDILLSEAKLKPLRFVSSKEIAQRIKPKFNKPRLNPTLSIGGIKDNKVLIINEKLAKSGGYKLPCNEVELHSFYNNITLNVVPQLRR